MYVTLISFATADWKKKFRGAICVFNVILWSQQWSLYHQLGTAQKIKTLNSSTSNVLCVTLIFPILLPAGPIVPPKPTFLSTKPSPNHVPAPEPSLPAESTNGSEFDSPLPAEDGETPSLPLLDPKKCEVRAGKETTLEITKEKMGLGLSIVGGSDTPLVSLLEFLNWFKQMIMFI